MSRAWYKYHFAKLTADNGVHTGAQRRVTQWTVSQWSSENMDSCVVATKIIKCDFTSNIIIYYYYYYYKHL